MSLFIMSLYSDPSCLIILIHHVSLFWSIMSLYSDQCCGFGSIGSGTYQSTGSRSLKSKTSTKEYELWVKILYQFWEEQKIQQKILKYFDFGSDSSRIRIRWKIVWIRNTASDPSGLFFWSIVALFLCDPLEEKKNLTREKNQKIKKNTINILIKYHPENVYLKQHMKNQKRNDRTSQDKIGTGSLKNMG